jgi:glutathione S-transferase
MPKYLGYFESMLNRSRSDYFFGRRCTYVDLSLFQVIEGLRYAFPTAMKRLEKKHRRSVALRDRVAARPRLAAYLSSEHRIPFNQEGIFRHYIELDR